jgi:hypothetical protein
LTQAVDHAGRYVDQIGGVSGMGLGDRFPELLSQTGIAFGKATG